jgi:ubiquitin-protein ligase E3 A
LLFSTGSDRSPLRGLSDLRFILARQAQDDTRLPSSHTCFNHFLLPDYSTKEILKQKLLQSLQNAEGFGLM